jgi:hypothetical protein
MLDLEPSLHPIRRPDGDRPAEDVGLLGDGAAPRWWDWTAAGAAGPAWPDSRDTA